MRAFAAKIRARLGGYWWNSLVVFAAFRISDVVNAFVGLWLVPRYVSPEELGAVAPLALFAGYLAIPAAAFANVFRNEVSSLALAGEFGRLKTLVRGVFLASAAFLAVAVVAARLVLPLFLERLRIAEGSLCTVILAASFCAAVAPVYTNVLQALGKFGAFSAIACLAAPARLATMLATMPFRAVTGYFAGQTAAPAFQMAASACFLKKELSAKAEPYWSGAVARRFRALFRLFLLFGFTSALPQLVESLIIRQRLPEMDSAGYYMATRISEISTYLCCTLAFTVFPYSAEKAARGEDVRPLAVKSSAVILVFGALVALASLAFARPLLEALPHGAEYSRYAKFVPVLACTASLAGCATVFTAVETAAGRFSFLKWTAPLDVAYPAALFLVTGYGYSRGIAPDRVVAFLDAHNIRSLGTMICWMAAYAAVRFAICAFLVSRRRPADASARHLDAR